MKNLHDLEISVYSTHSFCITNPQNWRKLKKSWYYWQKKDWITFYQTWTNFLICEISRKLNQDSFLLEIQQKESRHTRINTDWLILVSLHVKHSKSIIWHIWLVPLKFYERKLKHIQYSKSSTNSANLSCTMNPRNRRKVQNVSYY